MIRFANINTMPLVRDMWKLCFEDSEYFLDLHFSRKYKHENTLLFFEGEKAVASLQMFEYTITFYKKEIPVYYLAGLCTLPQYRQKGYMAQLMHASHMVMKERGIPLSILVPAEEWLFVFYEKYGYQQVFDGKNEIFPLKQILESATDLKGAYDIFCSKTRTQDFYVQKSFEDFSIIADEYKIDGCPVKYNLSGMACIIDDHYLIDLYNGQRQRAKSPKITRAGDTPPDYIVEYEKEQINTGADTRLLCRLLFGYKTNELMYPLNKFPEHHAVMNLMLE